jgi:glycine cleavage system regulatory protein
MMAKKSPNSMTKRAVILFSSPNRVGLFERVCQFVKKYDGNIIHNTVNVFDDSAVICVQFELPDSQLTTMKSQFKKLKLRETDVIHLIELQGANPNTDKEARPKTEKILIWCKDFPGLLAKLTSLMARHEIDIHSHRGDRTPSAEYEWEYKQRLTLTVPAGGEWDLFKKDLQALLDDMQPPGRWDVNQR